MNLLMISVDDLRPLLGSYGQSQMHTPNIDRLAAQGVRFSKAYCQVPVCGASRASLMTGLRPTPNRFTTYHARADKDAEGTPTMLHSLKDAGYTTACNPKVLHEFDDHAALWDAFDIAPLPTFPGPYYTDEAVRMAEEAHASREQRPQPWMKAGPAFECADVPDEAYHDGASVRTAIVHLQRFAKTGERFMYGYGSINVHLPFKAPKPYWDLYDPALITLPAHDEPASDVPAAALHTWQELRNYVGIPGDGPLDDELARTLVHGYMAGVSYLDAQVGKLLDALDESGLSETTSVVFWVDHGFNLGEHGLWCKHCLYETSLHVPLIIRPPTSAGFTPGTVIERVVENLDVYPTICELLGLPTPEHVQGKSLLALMRDPQAPHKERAYSRYGNGESVRTERFRYSEYWNDEGECHARTLFDLTADPDELKNLADGHAHDEVMQGLSQELKDLHATP